MSIHKLLLVPLFIASLAGCGDDLDELEDVARTIRWRTDAGVEADSGADQDAAAD